MTGGDLFLRVTDAALGLLWAWVLFLSLRHGRIGGARGFMWQRADAPGRYWLIIALLALMVLHFCGLAWAGQVR